MQATTEKKVELKYCERCGGLWLRWEGSLERYCLYCAPEMQEVAVRGKKPPMSMKVLAQGGGVVCA
jgi:hypothetical protein